MNTQDHLIKSIIFRPELVPFVKDEDNCLSFLEEYEVGDYLEDGQSDAEEESSLMFIESEYESSNNPEPGLLNLSEWVRNLRQRAVSIAA